MERFPAGQGHIFSNLQFFFSFPNYEKMVFWMKLFCFMLFIYIQNITVKLCTFLQYIIIFFPSFN